MHTAKNLTLLKELTDNYLMELVQGGDFSKMGVLYERYHRRVFAYFYRCTSDQSKSEDLVHNVFMRLLKYRDSFKGEGQFVHWLFTIVRNTWFDLNRKKDVLKHADDLDGIRENVVAESNDEEADYKNDRIKLMRRAMEELSSEKREAILLSRYEGLKYTEIASICECSVSAIKTRVQRGLIDLKRIMQELES